MSDSMLGAKVEHSLSFRHMVHIVQDQAVRLQQMQELYRQAVRGVVQTGSQAATCKRCSSGTDRQSGSTDAGVVQTGNQAATDAGVGQTGSQAIFQMQELHRQAVRLQKMQELYRQAVRLQRMRELYRQEVKLNRCRSCRQSGCIRYRGCKGRLDWSGCNRYSSYADRQSGCNRYRSFKGRLDVARL